MPACPRTRRALADLLTQTRTRGPRRCVRYPRTGLHIRPGRAPERPRRARLLRASTRGRTDSGYPCCDTGTPHCASLPPNLPVITRDSILPGQVHRESSSYHIVASTTWTKACLLYTSDAADDLLCVDLGGRRIIKKKK